MQSVAALAPREAEQAEVDVETEPSQPVQSCGPISNFCVRQHGRVRQHQSDISTLHSFCAHNHIDLRSDPARPANPRSAQLARARIIRDFCPVESTDV